MRRGGRRLPEELPIAVYIVLALPLILLGLPLVLPYLAWQERRRRCPVCGRRGTLSVVARPSSGEDQDTDWTILELERVVRRRVNPETTRLRCAHCGSEFSRAELARLGVPV